MEIPIFFSFFGQEYNLHFIFETLAFFLGYRYFVVLRKRQKDPITIDNRLLIILGATFGALLGSRLLGALESPRLLLQLDIRQIYSSKTIVGGLFGGLLGVEAIKKIVGERQSSGDLFVFPILLGMGVGRIGCWLSGVLEPTYGIETTFFAGMDLGDGVQRHPTALYEILFLVFFFAVLQCIVRRIELKNGSLFQIFMVGYFMFRFFLEYIKPNTFFLWGMSSIQIACLVCFGYYYNVFLKPKSLAL